MTQMKNTLLIFIPAIVILGIALTIRITQFNRDGNTSPEQQDAPSSLSIPILDDDPIIGNKKAPITIITFEDLGCSHCQEQNTVFSDLVEKYPKQVKVIWKSLTVTKFPHDTREAHAIAFCANRQHTFTEFKDLAFANYQQLSSPILSQIVSETSLNQSKLSTCLQDPNVEEYLKKNEAIARTLGIQAVPAIFVDGVQAQTLTTLQEWEVFLNLAQ